MFLHSYYSSLIWIILRGKTFHEFPKQILAASCKELLYCNTNCPWRLDWTPFSSSLSTTGWRTLPGVCWGAAEEVQRGDLRPTALCWLSMRPLYQRGKDSISQWTSPPWAQSAQCSRPTAHEWDLSGWLKTLLCSPWRVTLPYFYFFLNTKSLALSLYVLLSMLITLDVIHCHSSPVWCSEILIV